LPELDVLNILKNIRSDSSLDTIPLVAVTNASINDDEIKEIHKEYDELVSKPISITLLMNKIDSILAKSKKYTIR
jgi:DNA-binding response OmpR family regulator